jgi:small multidrug resistance family-3 protein
LDILRTIVLFVLAGLAEIGGAYLVWQWRNGGKPAWFALAGALVLFLYSFIQTAQSFSFGRAFAAYGGVFIAMATLWAYWVDDWRPDRFDLIGVGIALTGVGVIIWGRNWF